MDSCVFCKIIKGEIPSTKLYEDEDFIVIMDIAPAAKGHAILIAKQHAENLFALKEPVAQRVLPVVQKVAQAIKETLACDGMNILQNNGEAAGQTVFHFHVHMIPRYYKDTVSVGWKKKTYKDGEMQSVADKIREKL